VARRLASEIAAELERFRAPRRARSFGVDALLSATNSITIDGLWSRSAALPYFVLDVTRETLASLCSGDEQRIIALAGQALDREVQLLGSRRIRLGRPIDWSTDVKSGFSWKKGYARRLVVADPKNHADVKFPWELSRLQWLIPLGQAYVLTQEERFARGAREILDEWIAGNPYGMTVNWAIAMEPALRIITWSWLFHTLAGSAEWRERGFRERFLRMFFLQADWVERNLERSDVNGNHYTADAAGLVFAGLFFGDGEAPQRWARLGWEMLETEIRRQVDEDGVDFEASTAYHRLVSELFLLPALYRERWGLRTPNSYRERLVAMARFVAAYSRDDGSSPQWGDADDGRALPLGTQLLRDHRYLLGLTGTAFQVVDLEAQFAGPLGEVLWLLGSDAARRLSACAHRLESHSSAFSDAGIYVMRSPRDHVFVDAGPVGMRGRGGHGHNDCLSFEAALDGVHLIVDPGAYVYTASYQWRNRFRSTAFHNTPVVDNEEQNRLVAPGYLWSLHDDARPTIEQWRSDPSRDVLTASHTGYQRLSNPVTVARTVILDKNAHRLLVRDVFRGTGEHSLNVPYHLARLAVAMALSNVIRLEAYGSSFELHWQPGGSWRASIVDGWISPSYGVKRPVPVVELTRSGVLVPLLVVIAPQGYEPSALFSWATETLRQEDSVP